MINKEQMEKLEKPDDMPDSELGQLLWWDSMSEERRKFASRAFVDVAEISYQLGKSRSSFL